MRVADLITKEKALRDSLYEFEHAVRTICGCYERKDWLEHAKKDQRQPVKLILNEYLKLEDEYNRLLKSDIYLFL